MNIRQKLYRKLSYRLIKLKGYTKVSMEGQTCGIKLDSLGEAKAVFHIKKFERRMIEGIIRSLDEGDVFLDVGANIGLISCLGAKKVGVPGSVVAVEPFRANIRKLRDVLEFNEVENAQIVESPLGHKEVKAKLESNEERTKVNGVVNLELNQDGSMKAIPGDRIFRGSEVPKTIKIDVEGAEGLVLQGLKETIAKPKCRNIFMELHYPASTIERNSMQSYGTKEKEIKELLKSKGFTIETLTERTDEKHILATKNE